MINLNTFQIKIINFYLLPILIFSFIFSIFINYNFMKFFRNDVEFNNKIETIKEIQRKNIILNGVELKKWTTLTDSQKDFFLKEENKEKLEDKDKFKIKYKIEVIKDYINDDNKDEQYNFIIFIKTMFQSFFFSIFSMILLFSIPLFSLYKFYKEYYLKKLKSSEKLYNLPFYLKKLTSSLNNETNDKFIDKYIGYDKNKLEYSFKTYSINQKKIYEDNIDRIQNYLKIFNIKVIQEDLIIKLCIKTIPNILKFDKSKYNKNELYLGKTENNKDVILNINHIKHTLLIGETGSGKSVFVQNFLLSVFKNIDEYEKIYLIDFKIMEMAMYENTNSKIEVVKYMNEFIKLVEDLEKLMFERNEISSNLKLRNFYGKKILVFIDEFRTIENNNLDKKTQDKMKGILINLLQKSRRSKIFFVFRGQKRDTQNLDSSIYSNIITKICMKTSNTDNLLKVRGTQEELKEYETSHSEIKNFPRGRSFFTDGESGNKFLIQSPFLNLDIDEHRFFMYGLLGLNDKEIRKNIDRLNYINNLIHQKENGIIKTEEEFLKLVNEYDLKIKNDLEKELNKNLINDNDNNDIEKIEKIEKNNEIFASFEEEKTEKIEVLTDNKKENFKDNHFTDLEEIRLKKWKETYNLESKTEQSQKRKILFQVKKMIEKNELEERKNILNTL